MAKAHVSQSGDTYFFVDITSNEGLLFTVVIDLEGDDDEPDEVRVYREMGVDPVAVVQLQHSHVTEGET